MDLEQQLRAALVPCRPGPGLRAGVMARVSATPGHTSRGAGKRGRLLLVGTVLIIAAAAAMIALRLREMPKPQMETVTPDPPSIRAVKSAVASLMTPGAPAPQPVAEQAASVPVPASRSFTVRMALEDKTTDAAARAVVGSYYTAFLDRLRVIPGLILITPDSVDVEVDKPIDFRITITGDGPDPGGQFSERMRAEKLGPDGVVNAIMNSGMSAGIVPNCIGPAAADVSMLVLSEPLSCRDPATMAAHDVTELRARMFPPDASLRRQLQSQMVDRRLDPQQRLMAMGSIASLRNSQASDSSIIAGTTAQLDPEFVRGAIDLATRATDPTLRAQVWRTMREVHSPELIQPLIAASRHDLDGEARLEAVATLANFASDEVVRATLESVAEKDSRPLVRAIARRGLAGNAVTWMDAGWKEYVVTSLKDESRSNAERIEALAYYTFDRSLPGSIANYWIFTSRLLDDDVTRALTQVVPKLSVSAELTQPMLEIMVRDVVSINHPAVTDMLLDSLQGDGVVVDKATAVGALLGHGDDPRVLTALKQSSDVRVREVLQQASTDDPDPKRREMAARALDST